jgi:ribosomal protein S18 acetylase RimI-like enzyme
MKVESLAFQTDLFFHRFNGIVFEYDDYLIIKTPSNPTFFWGNLLYFKNPPTENSFIEWQRCFKQQFESMNAEHMTFAWDSTNGEIGASDLFVKEGFDLEKSVVMVADQIIRPAKINSDIVVRPITSEEEWQMVIENHVLCRGKDFEETPYRKYATRKIADYRRMLKEKRGEWFGAFLGEKLVGDLGLFWEKELGRFQTVGTHPDFRRMGVCSALVYHTSIYAMEAQKLKQLVMVADPEYHAARIYESVGFKVREWQVGLCRYNKKIWATNS